MKTQDLEQGSSKPLSDKMILLAFIFGALLLFGNLLKKTFGCPPPCPPCNHWDDQLNKCVGCDPSWCEQACINDERCAGSPRPCCLTCGGDPNKHCCPAPHNDHCCPNNKTCCQGNCCPKSVGPFSGCCEDETGEVLCETSQGCGCDPINVSCNVKKERQPASGGPAYIPYGNGNKCVVFEGNVPCYQWRSCTQAGAHWAEICWCSNPYVPECYCSVFAWPYCDECVGTGIWRTEKGNSYRCVAP